MGRYLHGGVLHWIVCGVMLFASARLVSAQPFLDESYFAAQRAAYLETERGALIRAWIRSSDYAGKYDEDLIVEKILNHENEQDWADVHIDSDNPMYVIAAAGIIALGSDERDAYQVLFQRKPNLWRVRTDLVHQPNLRQYMHVDSALTRDLPAHWIKPDSPHKDFILRLLETPPDDDDLRALRSLAWEHLELVAKGQQVDVSAFRPMILVYTNYVEDREFLDLLYDSDSADPAIYRGMLSEVAGRARGGVLLQWGLDRVAAYRDEGCEDIGDTLAYNWLETFLRANMDKEGVLALVEDLLLKNPGCYWQYRQGLLDLLAADDYWQTSQVNRVEMLRILHRYHQREAALTERAAKYEEEMRVMVRGLYGDDYLNAIGLAR